MMFGGPEMNVKKINEMTKEELLLYIGDRVNNIEEGLKNYNEYYNNKRADFFEKAFNMDLLTEDLKTIAYYIKNVNEHVEWTYNKQTIIDALPHNLNKKPRRGEIWTCQLGKNIGSEENKIRPVIIIQNNTGNEKSPTTIIVPISNRPKKISVHIRLKNSDYALAEGETEFITGTILCEQIKIVSKARLGRHIATLKDNFVSNILDVKLKHSIKL